MGYDEEGGGGAVGDVSKEVSIFSWWRVHFSSISFIFDNKKKWSQAYIFDVGNGLGIQEYRFNFAKRSACFALWLV